MKLEEVAALVTDVLADPARRDELVAVLAEPARWPRALGPSEEAQARGFVLATFAQVGLPPAALSFALEELESGHHAYAIAGAARALRGSSSPLSELEPYLERALSNLVGRDERVSFGSLAEADDPVGLVTASDEVRTTLSWLRAAESARCCELPALAWGKSWLCAQERARTRALGVQLEDQDGRRAGLRVRLAGRPALVTFFYTRCENPRKCSLTIAKLAALQRRLAREGLTGRVRIAAISYDPVFDSPERLGRYAEQRGLRLGSDAFALRSVAGFAELERAFALGVSFRGAAVARHSVELFLLDAQGRTAGAFKRLSWQEDEVLARCRDLLAEPPARASAAWLSLAPPVLLALLPKCPLCWAAYASALGVAGASQLPYPAFAAPLLFGLMLLGVLLSAVRAKRTAYYSPLGLSAVGALLLAPLALGRDAPWLALGGALCSFAGAVLGARRARAEPMRVGSAALTGELS